MAETTDTLRWTALRHRMLREVDADATAALASSTPGKTRKFRFWPSTPNSPHLYEHRRRELTGAEKATLTTLLHERLIVPVPLGLASLASGLAPVAAGLALLSRWDAEHPEGGDHAAPDH